MWTFVWTLIINAVAVFITAYLLPGVSVKNFGHAILVALVLGVINAVVKPVLLFLTIPITLLTLGLFILVINALLIMLVDLILSGFKVKNFGWALLFSIVLSLINGILGFILL